MKRALIGFFLGIFPFYLSMFVFETIAAMTPGYVAIIAGIVVMMAYYFFCQFLLSRGRSDVLFKDWPIMIALGAPGLAISIIEASNKSLKAFLSWVLGFIIVCSVGILCGAFVASRQARRREARQAL